MRPETINALLAEASDRLGDWMVLSRRRVTDAHWKVGATAFEVEAALAWLDVEHGHWVEVALADLRERLIDEWSTERRLH